MVLSQQFGIPQKTCFSYMLTSNLIEIFSLYLVTEPPRSWQRLKQFSPISASHYRFSQNFLFFQLYYSYLLLVTVPAAKLLFPMTVLVASGFFVNLSRGTMFLLGNCSDNAKFLFGPFHLAPPLYWLFLQRFSCYQSKIFFGYSSIVN